MQFDAQLSYSFNPRRSLLGLYNYIYIYLYFDILQNAAHPLQPPRYRHLWPNLGNEQPAVFDAHRAPPSTSLSVPASFAKNNSLPHTTSFPPPATCHRLPVACRPFPVGWPTCTTVITSSCTLASVGQGRGGTGARGRVRRKVFILLYYNPTNACV